MAITILSQPTANLLAAYNPISYRINSTNKHLPAFRYLVQVKNILDSTTMATYELIPDPLDNGYANVDISRVVQNSVDTYLDMNNITSATATGAFTRIQVAFGESYVSTWNYNSYIFLPGNKIGFTTSTTYNPAFSNVQHTYSVGDQILVQLPITYNDTRDLLNGYWTVTDVLDSNRTIQVNFDYSWVGAHPVTPGSSSYADQRKTKSYIANSNFKYVTNTVLDPGHMADFGNNLNNWLAGNSNRELLTNIPTRYSTIDSGDMWMNFNATPAGTMVSYITDDGRRYNKSIPGSPDQWFTSVGVGPNNFGTTTPVGGATYPIIKPDTEWYEIHYYNNPGTTAFAAPKRVYIDKRCRINDITLLFMDRKGCYANFAFTNKKVGKITTATETYTAHTNSTATEARGVGGYYSSYSKSIDLVSKPMNEDMSLYFEELLTSRYIYIKLDGRYYPCTIDNSSYTTAVDQNARLITKQLTVQYLLDNTIN